MTEKKKSPAKEAAPEQGEKKVKAKTGSWWKSSSKDEATAKGAGPEQAIVPEAPVEAKKTEKKAARTPARPRRKKNNISEVIESASQEEQANIYETRTNQEDKPGEGEVGATSPTPEKKTARRPARPRRKKTELVSEVVDSSLVAPVGEEVASQDVTAASGLNKESEEGSAAITSTPQKKSGRRPARPRRKKPDTEMPAVPASEGADLVIAPEAAPEQEQTEVVADQPATPEQIGQKAKRSPRSRGRRKPTAELDIQNEDDDEVPDVEEEKTKTTISRLLINAEEPEECRIAMLEDGRLESLHVSTIAREHTKSNIYKARIVAVESNLQAVFVDYGTEKNGFLPFSEIHPEYYRQNISDKTMKLIEQHQ